MGGLTEMLGLRKLWAKFNPFDIDKHINAALSLIGQAKQESIDCKNEIIEVKRMIETIKNEYERYKHFSVALGDGMTDMLWLKDTDGRYVFANPSIIKNLLCTDTLSNTLGKTDVQIAREAKAIYGRNNHTFGEVCGNSDLVVLQTERPQTFLEFGKVRGKDLYLEVRKFVMRDEKGNIIGVGGTGRDITEYYLGLKEAIDGMGCNGAFSKAPCVTRLMSELDKYRFEGCAVER